MRALVKLRRHLLVRFAHDDTRRVPAVEFALILPLLLLLYLGSIEASSLLHGRPAHRGDRLDGRGPRGALESRRHAVRQIRRCRTISPRRRGILTPYSTTSLTQVVSFVSVTAAGVAKVVWSCAYNGGIARLANTTYVAADQHEEPRTNTAKGGYLSRLGRRATPTSRCWGWCSLRRSTSTTKLCSCRASAEIAAPASGCPT